MTEKRTNKRPIPIVRLIVPDKNGRALILKRSSTDFGGGKWCLPGGKIDYGQTLESAISDELHEETSLECQSHRFLFFQDNLPVEFGDTHWLNLFFECKASGLITLNKESCDYAWIKPEDLGKYDFAFQNKDALKKYWDLKVG